MRDLGRGGAAVVYLARQDPFDREVAVKVLRRGVDEAKLWQRFLREAQAVGRLSGHPHVLTVHAAGRSRMGEPYLVTEYMDRGSLDDVIAVDGPLSVAMVTGVGVAIADALTAAHRVGVLHRDVKPGNVLLGRDGRVKLGDFGIARLLAGHSATSTDAVAFTPEHVAPEILRGDSDGSWTDLYGLASTLATALVGAPLFRRRPDERIESLLTRKLMAPAPLLPYSVPEPLARLLTAALDPEPGRRPSLAEFRRQLAAAVETSNKTSSPASLPAPARADARVRASAGTIVADDHYPADVAGESSALSMVRVRRRRVAALAGFLAVLVTIATAWVVARIGGDGGDASSTTSAIATLPVTSAPAAGGAPTGVALATNPARTVAPVAPTAAPVATTQRVGVLVITSQEVETFVRDYYDAVAAGNYETSWSQLSPEFQSGMARSYDYYVNFWNQNDIEIGDVEVVDADQRRLLVNVQIRWNGNSTVETNQFTLRPNANGDLLIASQVAVDD